MFTRKFVLFMHLFNDCDCFKFQFISKNQSFTDSVNQWIRKLITDPFLHAWIVCTHGESIAIFGVNVERLGYMFGKTHTFAIFLLNRWMRFKASRTRSGCSRCTPITSVKLGSSSRHSNSVTEASVYPVLRSNHSYRTAPSKSLWWCRGK